MIPTQATPKNLPESTVKPEPQETLIKAWKIEPCGQTEIDAVIIRDDGTWSQVLPELEYALEQQIESPDGGGKNERPWDQIKVTITGALLTQEQWDELTNME